MRLIDAEDLDFYFCEDVFECQEEVHRAQTLTFDDLRPKGRWRGITTSYGEKAVCSECGFDMFVNEPGNGLRNIEDLCFCPHCGAKMDQEDAHGQN